MQKKLKILMIIDNFLEVIIIRSKQQERNFNIFMSLCLLPYSEKKKFAYLDLVCFDPVAMFIIRRLVLAKL